MPDAVTSSVSHSHRPRPGEESDVVVRVYALTDVGHTRDHNEDTFLVADLSTGMTVGSCVLGDFTPYERTPG